MMAAGGFDLKKWASNVSEIVAHLPESDREVKVPIELNANDPIKALGIDWNTATDSFGFKSTLDPNDNKPFTKRSALSTVSKLFDPIGLIAPIIVIAKIFMKKVWATTLDWDDSLPSILRNEWVHYIEGLQHISEIKIPRWINTGKGNKSIQIHGFCDASEMAYGAALYIRTIDQNNEVHVHLISSKSKVSPKKALTMPRLELCGAHLLSSLLSSIRRGFRHASISSEDIVLWCYSEIVCYWLRNTKPLKVFVANRVSKINELTEGIRWSHVRTHDNPADLVSRGISPKELANNSLWWHGPPWLLLPSEEWPTSRQLHRKTSIWKFVVSFKPTFVFSQPTSFNVFPTTIVCCVCRHMSNRIVGKLTHEDLKAARKHWIIWTQKQFYFDELKCCQRHPPNALDSKSKLLALSPFVDEIEGFLRVRGRLDNAMLAYDEMHPIILPPDAHFTHLLIDCYHRRTMHDGPQLMMSRLRRNFWIVNARNAIRHRIRKCIVCFRQRAKTSQQLMASLPAPRVRQTSRPFLHTGVDYCGPFELRASKGRGIKAYKAYIAVLVCLTTKAIHVECVDGLTTDAFLAAFRRFVARRGLPSDVYSDNGTNFVGAANELDRQFKRMTRDIEENIAGKYIEDGIRWHFIPPGSPHFGGLWSLASNPSNTIFDASSANTNLHLKR